MIKKNRSLYYKRSVLAVLLAQVLLEKNRSIYLLDASATDVGFSVDIAGSLEGNEDFFRVIECAMSDLWSENPAASLHHMMRENSVDYMESLGHPLLSEVMKEDERNIVDILQVGDCSLYLSSSLSEEEEVEALPHFHLFSMRKLQDEGLEGDVVRVEGAAFDDKRALKQFLKLQTRATRWDHLKAGEEQNLFSYSERECLWLSNGIALCAFIKEYVERSLTELDFHQVAFSSDRVQPKKDWSFFSHLKKLGIAQAFEFGELDQHPAVGERALFSFEKGWSERETMIVAQRDLSTELERLISWMESSFSYFGVTHRWVLRGEDSLLGQLFEKIGLELSSESSVSSGDLKLEVRWIDGFGREQRGGWISLTKFESKRVVQSSLIGNIHSFVAAIIEGVKGELPFRLAPVQIAVVAVGQNYQEYAKQQAEKGRRLGFRVKFVASGEKVGERIFSLEKENVPYVIIVGEKEKRKSMVSVRMKERKWQPVMLTMEELLADIQQKMLN